MPQLWQCLEFFLYSVQYSRTKLDSLVFIYEWIHLCICCMWNDGSLAVCVCVCVWEREREREREWIEEFRWIEWMPFLWPLNKMTYFSDRTLFFCRERASPLPVFFLCFFQDIVSLYVGCFLCAFITCNNNSNLTIIKNQVCVCKTPGLTLWLCSGQIDPRKIFFFPKILVNVIALDSNSLTLCT